jgi:hypothetical protein
LSDKLPAMDCVHSDYLIDVNHPRQVSAQSELMSGLSGPSLGQYTTVGFVAIIDEFSAPG